MNIFRHKRMTVLAAVVAAAVLVPVAAATDPPQHQTVPISFSLVDFSLCGFAIDETATGQIDKTIFADGSQIWHIHRLGTFSANGTTLTSEANFTRFLDPAQPELINDSGTIFSIQIPGEGAVFMQAGRLLENLMTGQVYFDAGPGQFVSGDAGSFCAYLGS
jgi:hypothetical protein